MIDQHQPPHSGNHAGVPQGAVRRVARPGAEETFTDAAAQAGKKPQAMSVRGERHRMKHPYLTAGAMFGVGALLGALAHRLFGHRTTLFELLGLEVQPSRRAGGGEPAPKD